MFIIEFIASVCDAITDVSLLHKGQSRQRERGWIDCDLNIIVLCNVRWWRGEVSQSHLRSPDHLTTVREVTASLTGRKAERIVGVVTTEISFNSCLLLLLVWPSRHRAESNTNMEENHIEGGSFIQE